MNHKIKELLFAAKQGLATFLSVILIMNMAAPVAAQSRQTQSNTRGKAGTRVQTRLTSDHIDQTLRKKIEEENNRIFVAESTNTMTPQKRLQQQIVSEYASDPIYQRLWALEQAFSHSPSISDKTVETLHQEFISQYNNEVENAVKDALKELAAREKAQRALIQEEVARGKEAGASESAIDAFVKAESDKLDETLAAARAKVQAWRAQSLSHAEQEYQKATEEAAVESRKIIRTHLKELLDLYHKYPGKALDTLLRVSSSVLMADGRTTTLFTAQEKEMLRQQYIKAITEGGSQCVTGKKTNSFYTYSCTTVLGCVTALGIIGQESDASIIGDLVVQSMTTPNAAAILLPGFSAILALGNYRAANRILYEATEKEQNFDLDLLSVTTWVEELGTLKGKYLGEISKYAQFPVPSADGKVTPAAETPSGNAWEEVAYMLAMEAAEGHRSAQELLDQYGINRCVSVESVNYFEDGASCSGIKPFIAGAVMSGQSGKYTAITGHVYRAGEQYLDAQGRAHIVSEVSAENQQKRIAVNQSTMYASAKKRGMTPAQYIMWSLFNNRMGDLNTEDEMLLDSKLYAAFNESTKKQSGIPAQYRIKPWGKTGPDGKLDPVYRAKQAAVERMKIARIVGNIADVAIIIWAIWDLGRLAIRGSKMVGRLVHSSIKMARAGNTIKVAANAPKSVKAAALAAERARIMWETKTARLLYKTQRAFPARIKNGMAGSVRALLPQFTHVEPLLDPAMLSRSVARTALDGAKWSAETGALVVDVPGVVSQTMVTGLERGAGIPAFNPLSGEQIAATAGGLQGELTAVTNQTNAAFASRGSWMRWVDGFKMPVFSTTEGGAFAWQLDKLGNIRYRAQLSKGIANLGKFDDAAAAGDFAAAVRSNTNITIPSVVNQMSSRPLIGKNGGISGGTLRAWTDPVLPGGGTPAVRADIRSAIKLAQEQTNLQYANRSWWSRLWSNQKTYNNLLANNIMHLTENNAVLTSLPALERERVVGTLAKNIFNTHNIPVPSNIGIYAGRAFNEPKLTYKTLQTSLMDGSGVLPASMIEFNVEAGKLGISKKAGDYQRMVLKLDPKIDAYRLGVADGTGAFTGLPRFKVGVPQASMPNLIRNAVETGTGLEIKLDAYRSASAFKSAAKLATGGSTLEVPTFANWWSRTGQSLRNLGRKKTNIWIDEVPVFLRGTEGGLLSTPVVIKADAALGLGANGSRFVLEGNNLRLLTSANHTVDPGLFHFSLPKKQLPGLVKMIESGKMLSPLKLTASSPDWLGVNWRLNSLMVATGLSLSSASVGLITPLETTYKDHITETDKALISLAFPYIPSLLVPMLAPFVMRFGALNVVKTALGMAAAGTAFAWAAGFNGELNLNKLPAIWPLFVSGTAIGLSSALSRSGLNILIDTMGGGGSLLKSMAFKNAGSLFLLMPSWLYGYWKLSAQPALTGTTLTEKQLQDPGKDFSWAFPVLTVITTGVLSWVSLSGIDRNIGRTAAVIKGEKMLFGKEIIKSVKLTFAKEALPLAAGAFFFTGFESAAFSKAANQSIKPEYQESKWMNNVVPGNRNNTLALATGVTVAAFPFATRLLAPKALDLMKNPLNSGTAYRRMLGLSYGLNAAGGALMFSYGLEGENAQPWKMWTGALLMGIGTANVTQSLQKLANISIAKGSTMKRYTAGLSGKAATDMVTDLKTITMSGFSWSQLGLAVVPLVQSRYADAQITAGYETRDKAIQSTLWIPLSSLALSSVLIAPSVLNFRYRLPPLGTLGVTKLALDGVDSFNLLPHAMPLYQSYQQLRSSAMQQSIRNHEKESQAKKEAEQERREAAEKEQAEEK